MTEEQKLPGILKPFRTAESIWCKNCGHHVTVIVDMKQVIDKMQRTIK